VKLASKVGVSMLALLLFATPIMACALPAMAMAKAERECCKRMAQDCGKSGAPQSHSCCQSTTAQDHLPASKSSPDVSSKHLTLVLLSAPPPMPAAAIGMQFGSQWWASDIHSPPVSPPVSISVLRI
jgi:hypothetical protein